MPFYVGATAKTLKDRLNGHITSRFAPFYSQSPSAKRYKLLCELMDSGTPPKISCLIAVSPDNCDLFERAYYNLFISSGIDLLQDANRFTYQGHYHKNKLNK